MANIKPTYSPINWSQVNVINRSDLDRSETQAEAALKDIASYLQPILDIYHIKVDTQDAAVPVGSIFAWPYPGTISPPMIEANGQFLNPEDYPALFAIYGYTFGQMSDKFKVPDYRGRTVIGMNSEDENFSSMNKAGGAVEISLTEDQNATHNHQFVMLSFGPETDGNSTTLAGYNMESTGHTGVGGGGKPHNNMPPYFTSKWVIRAF